MTWWRKRTRLRLVWWIVVLPLAIAAYAAAGMVPATWWYEPISLRVDDVTEGEVPIINVQRDIKRSFDGLYTASVWTDPPDGHVACAGSDTLRYKGGLYEPHDAPLTQWTDDPWCGLLPPGRYYVETCWTVLRPFGGIVPGKTVCAVSNIFTVHPREG